MTDRPTPRGIRNCNPGNIRNSHAFVWRGQIGADDAGFCIFKEPVWGLRALALLLQHYEKYYHCHTVYEFIARWAPPSENDTTLYAAYVAGQLGVDPYAVFDPHAQAAALIRAIVHYENGECPYSDVVIERGLIASHLH